MEAIQPIHKSRTVAFFATVLVVVLLLGIFAMPFSVNAASNQKTLSQDEVYQKIIAMKAKFPEGWFYTNADFYTWNGGHTVGGFGCVGFAFMLSDAAFGTLPAKLVYDFTYDQIRVGDVVRIDNDRHTVIVLEKHRDHVIVAEGNYNFRVHWGRRIEKAEIEKGNFLYTRYPDGDEDYGTYTASAMPFTDVKADAYYADAVLWATELGVTTGISNTLFGPDQVCTRAQIITFLWRAAGKPSMFWQTNQFTDVHKSDYYYDAVNWAVQNGITTGVSDNMFAPDATCTRAQVMTFLWRAVGKPSAGAKAAFRDVPSNAYYANAVQWACNNAVTTGTGSNLFSPDDGCTRAQVVTFLYRYYIMR